MEDIGLLIDGKDVPREMENYPDEFTRIELKQPICGKKYVDCEETLEEIAKKVNRIKRLRS